MAPIICSGIAKASVNTVWNTCFVPMKWERWDPDVNSMTNVSGPLIDGTTFIFNMKEGQAIKTTVSDVIENKNLRFSGAALRGLMAFNGIIELQSKGDFETEITYTFKLGGALGKLFAWAKPALVIKGTEGGLANMISISEEAESSASSGSNSSSA